jgi:hypothetical protein
MKPSLVQVNAPATNVPAINGTVDFTDSSVTNDLVSLITFGSEAVSNATNSAAAKLMIGCTDLVNNVAFFAGGQADAAPASTTNTGHTLSNTLCYMRASGGGTETVKAVLQHANDGIISNGARLNFSQTDGGTYLINGLMLAGTDVEVKTSTITFATTDTSKTFAHNLTGTPGILIFFIGNQSTSFDISNVPLTRSIGIWDGTNSFGHSFAFSANASPVQGSAAITADLGHYIFNNGVDFATWSVSGVGSTNLTISRTATNTQPAEVIVIGIRALSGTLAAKAFQTTTPTSSGFSTIVSGMTGQPQVLLTFPTRLTTNGSIVTDDSAGSYGMGVAVNNAGTTQQMSTAATIKSGAGVTTTVAKCQTFNNKALSIVDNTGAANVLATVNSWDSGGVTLNYSQNSGGGAYEVIGLAFGITAPSAQVVLMGQACL